MVTRAESAGRQAGRFQRLCLNNDDSAPGKKKEPGQGIACRPLTTLKSRSVLARYPARGPDAPRLLLRGCRTVRPVVSRRSGIDRRDPPRLAPFPARNRPCGERGSASGTRRRVPDDIVNGKGGLRQAAPRGGPGWGRWGLAGLPSWRVRAGPRRQRAGRRRMASRQARRVLLPEHWPEWLRADLPRFT